MPVSEATLWWACGVSLLVGFIVGKVHEYTRGKFARRYQNQLDQEMKMPLARQHPTVDEFFNQEATWEDPWVRVISDKGMKPIE